MNNNALFYDQIEGFLTGQLTSDQREAMERAVLEDHDLARAVELRRLEFEVAEALIAQNIRDQMVRLRLPQPPESLPAPSGEQYKLRIVWIIAALLSIAAIGIYWWNRQAAPPVPHLERLPSSAPGQTPPVQPDVPVADTPQTGNDPGSPSQKKKSTAPDDRLARQQLALATTLYQRPDLGTIRGTATAGSEAYERARSAWDKQDYTAALAALQDFSASDPQWMRALTLRAHAQFQLKRFAQASASLATIADRKIMPWSEEADWYVLLALLADGKASTADFRARLDRLLADTGHPYFEQAVALQARLPGQ